MEEKEKAYDPVPDLARVLAGLQVPRSIGGGAVLGAALEPYDRLRSELDLFGWRSPADAENALRRTLAGQLCLM